MKIIFSIFLLVAYPMSSNADQRVRKVVVKSDQVVTVKTSLGIATIVQVPDRPTSIVAGDQSAFKVEYLDQAITIKPLRSGARSNLYIYTDFRRFNVQLVTVDEATADYVVYLENQAEKNRGAPTPWKKYRANLTNNGLVFETKRIAKTRGGILLVEFEIKSRTRQKLKADWIWLKQSGATRPIHNLALSGQQIEPGKPVNGILQILHGDISETEPLRIELRREKTSYLTLPKVSAWK